MKDVILRIKNSGPYSAVRRFYYNTKDLNRTLDIMRMNRKLKRYNNINKGKRCVVIGNGPSLKIDDLTRLKNLGIMTFACNRISLAFSQTDWRPTYYFISDEKLLKGYNDDVDGVPIENRFFPEKFRDKGIKNGVFYHYLTDYDYEKEGKFSTDITKGLCGGGTVTVEMLQFAYYMGFSEIYLIGVDFSYAINNPLNDRTYAYQGEDNYFIKGYLKQGEVADQPNISANLLAFHAARNEIEGHNRIVMNATRGGKLEVFDRIDLDTLFAKWEDERI